MYSIVVDHPKRFEKALNKLPKHIQSKVITAIDELVKFPHITQIKKLKNSGYRLRIGDYRLLFDVEENHKHIVIYEIGHRREVYR